jgi:methionyl-tRNA formyltransferase
MGLGSLHTPGEEVLRHYVIATVKPWNTAAFRRHVTTWPGVWHLIERPEELILDSLTRLAPRYVFFPHWSWRVPADIFERFECVCFHLTDVPFGRGGSPLQNLIIRGCETTMVTALRMVAELDAGPVYLKRPLSLDGRAEEIFERAAEVIHNLIRDIVVREPMPVPQSGETVLFRRRTPEQSLLPKGASARELFDFIRMLDAPTYPKAFLDWGGLRLEFDHAQPPGSDSIEARVTIRAKSKS